MPNSIVSDLSCGEMQRFKVGQRFQLLNTRIGDEASFSMKFTKIGQSFQTVKFRVSGFWKV